MPIEIRELIVRARVEPGGDGAGAARPARIRSRRSEQEITRAVAQEVLRVIEEKRER